MFNGLLFHFGLKTVGLPRFELGQTEPKPVVLHYTIVQSLCAFLGKRCKDTFFLQYSPNIFALFFCNKVQMLNFAYKLKEINT